ncbi:uncharacterized protein LOC133711872 [Rosa rugosa]|nr:uncharacterized protein LOC133711872 [Rosa rugosa]
MSVSDLNICDPNNYKNKTVYCTAKIGKFVPEERWFYLACPKCFKEMRKKPQSQLLICAEHDMQQPLYSCTNEEVQQQLSQFMCPMPHHFPSHLKLPSIFDFGFQLS